MKALILIIVLIIANTIQAITGFAGPLISMPPAILLVGVDQAKAIITFIGWLAALIVTIQNFTYIKWKELGKMILFMFIGMYLGILLFDALPLNALLTFYAIVVLAIGAKNLLSQTLRKKERSSHKLPVPILFLVLIIAGMMQGMFTSGGSFLVIYAAVMLTDKTEFRATVSTVWVILNVFLMYNHFQWGFYTPETLKLIGLSIPPVFASIYIGNRIHDRLNAEAFLTFTYGLLIVSGGILLFT